MPGFMPKHTNPKYPPENFVTEQITGPGGFTGEASSGGPLRLWIYKKERSIKVGEYKTAKKQTFLDTKYVNAGPNPIRFRAPKVPTVPTDFVEGLIPCAENAHVLHY